jgi:uncharacterized membrane protein
LKQAVGQITPLPLFAIIAVTVSVENVNAIQEKILWSLYLAIIVSATTFLVTDIMENSAPDRIMESAIAANVLVIHSGIAQATLHVNVEPLMTRVSHRTESS